MSLEKIRVGVLRGGSGRDYRTSLDKGAAVISHLFENLEEKYKVFDIYIDKEGNWHIGGLPVSKESLPRKVDIVWDSSSHPQHSRVLSHFSIPSVKNDDFFYALTNSREMLAKHIKEAGIKTTRSILIPVFQEDFDISKEVYAKTKAKEVWQKFPAPWIVKSYTPESNMGIHLAKTFDELVRAIEDGIEHKKSILVEEFVSGRVGSMHTIPSFRKEESYTLLPSEFSNTEKAILEKIAKDLIGHLNPQHYLKIDFVMHPKLGFHLLALEFMPDMREGSHFFQACKRFGAHMHHVIDHIIGKAMNIL